MTPKAKNIVAWVIAILAGGFMILQGINKFIPSEAFDQMWTDIWGYPLWFKYVIGILEVAGGLGLFLLKFRVLAALGLIGLMLGAGVTHIRADQAEMLAMPMIPILLSAIIVFLRKEELPFNPVINKDTSIEKEIV
ncbi:MAG: DoxX family protein [Bacteroidota bacterium]